MAYARLALLAWQFRKEIAVGCLGILFLVMLGSVSLVAALFAIPMASEDHMRLYAQAAREIKRDKKIEVDFRLPMAIDAIRLEQDFRTVDLERARGTAALFVAAVVELGGRCQPGEPDCTCTSVFGVVTCWRPDIERYEVRTLGQVMNELSFTPEQEEMALAMVVVELGNFACIGFHPTEAVYIWPVHGLITSCYGHRIDPVEGYLHMHYGVDIAAEEGTPVKAAHTGKVILASYSGNYGNLIILATADGTLHTWYGHLSSYAIQHGDQVARGQVIGYIGSTGKSTGPHLHFETRQESGAIPIDPVTYYR